MPRLVPQRFVAPLADDVSLGKRVIVLEIIYSDSCGKAIVQTFVAIHETIY